MIFNKMSPGTQHNYLKQNCYCYILLYLLAVTLTECPYQVTIVGSPSLSRTHLTKRKVSSIYRSKLFIGIQRQSWVLRIPIVKGDSGFLELYSGLKSPGFRIPQLKFLGCGDSISKQISDSGIPHMERYQGTKRIGL